MTTRERRERKADRLREWAAGRRAKADGIERADRHLRDELNFVAAQPGIGGLPVTKRINRRQEREYELRTTAGKMAGRAAGIDDQLERSIYDDDPDAVERLHERIAQLEAKRDAIKAANVQRRKEGKEIAPAYVLQNLGADIRRNKQRLERLSRPPEEERPRYLYSVRYAATCRKCGRTIEKGAAALYFKQAGELACYPECEAKE